MSADAIYAKDVEGRFIYANPTLLAVIGKSAEEVLGRTDLEWHSDPEQAAIVMANDRRIMKAGASEVFEELWDTPNRGTRTFRSAKRPLFLEGGSVAGIVALSTDITSLKDARRAQKRAEEQASESAERLQLALSAAHMATWEWDLETDACIWNDEHYRMLGYEPGSVTPNYGAWARRVLPADLASIEARLRDMAKRGAEYVAEYRVLGQNDEVRWLEARGQRLGDMEGRAPRAVGVLMDVTARKQAEDALRAAHSKVERVLGSIAEGFLVLDKDWRYTYFNEQGARMIGMRVDQLLGGCVWDLFPHAQGTKFFEGYHRAVQTGQLVQFEEYYPEPLNKWLECHCYPSEDGLSVYFHDVTGRKQVERDLALAKAAADRANLAKSKFLAAASHDLRQPVQSLTLLLSVIERHLAEEPKTANLVNLASASLASLNGMLTGILDISRIDAGVVTPTFGSVDLGDLVDRLAREYAARAAALGLELRHAPRRVWARSDSALLERILRNLIENALRYTARGGVLIGLRSRGDCVRLDVIDTGIGIPADQQTEIFEEFRQLHNPARDSSKGLGLGLAIVSRLARLIGAEVQVASKLDRGSRFSVLLPLDKSGLSAVRSAPAVEDASGRILIIEDNAGVRQAYEIMLNDWGYETLSAASGEEALERAAQADWGFDAIIADHRLGPGLTGAAAAGEIARRAGRSFPTMLITGDTSHEGLADVSGFVLLHKPVKADDLRRKLASLLAGAPSPAAAGRA